MKPGTQAPSADLTAFALHRKKRRVIKLCLGFAYATKVSNHFSPLCELNLR
jgi:hypothetical protein